MEPPAQKLYMYLHTHWDREWYWSFGAYRTQLVQVVTQIVEKLEDGTLENFMLDGQTCLLEDLEEMVPGLTTRINRLVTNNLLSIGPWYVLADQLLVSGESLVRNLAHGIATSARFGKPSMIGYCPDTFGHTADLPRILKGFGIDNAVVWRGVPPLSGGPVFLWQSPDGSEVLTTHLARGYYQTAFHENVTSEKLADYMLSFLGEKRQDTSIVQTKDRSLTFSPEMNCALIPVGGDHLRPPTNLQPQANAALEVINACLPAPTYEGAGQPINGGALQARPVSLETFFEKAKEAFGLGNGSGNTANDNVNAIQVISGELRDNSVAFECERAYMLAGVLSTRLYLKRENRLSEHALIKRTEPMRTIMALADVIPYPFAELNNCWRMLLKNHPHDSICGCSVDEVHSEMQARTKSLHGQLAVLDRQAQEALTRKLAPHLPEVRLGLHSMNVLDPDQAENTAIIAINTSANPVSMPVAVRFAALAGKGDDLCKKLTAQGIQITSNTSHTEAFLELSGVPLFKQIELIEGFAFADNVPPFGFCTLPAAETRTSIVDSGSAAQFKDNLSNATDGLAIYNQNLLVYIDKKGALIVKEKKIDGLVTHKLGHRLVDTGDGGDTYNYDPLAMDAPVEATLRSVKKGLNGPLVSSLIVEYEIDIPAGLKNNGLDAKLLKHKFEVAEAPALPDLKRSNKTIKHKIVTEITLKANVPIVHFETRFKNKATDHRLEVVFSVAEKGRLKSTASENHYCLINRPVAKKSQLHPLYDQKAFVPLGHEGALDRHPCQRFFIADNQCFLNQGLPEYGAAENEVSITILRAVSYLSRNRLRTRGGGAGPNIATPEANSLGPNLVSYAWAPLVGDEHEQTNSAYNLAELYEQPLLAFVAPENKGESASFLEVDNEAIKIMASYMEEPEHITVRLLNVTSAPQSARLLGGRTMSLQKMDGSKIKELPLAGEVWGRPAFELEFKANELLTLKVGKLEVHKG